MKQELKSCPSCDFTKIKFNEFNEKYMKLREWDDFCPIVYKDRLHQDWIVECQNCGMSVLFDQKDEDENINLWNDLPRKDSLYQEKASS